MGKARFKGWRNTHSTSLWKKMQRICDQFLQFNLRLFSRMYYWGVKPGIVSAGLEFPWPKVTLGIKLELQHQLPITKAVRMKLFRETWKAPVQDPSGPPILLRFCEHLVHWSLPPLCRITTTPSLPTSSSTPSLTNPGHSSFSGLCKLFSWMNAQQLWL